MKWTMGAVAREMERHGKADMARQVRSLKMGEQPNADLEEEVGKVIRRSGRYAGSQGDPKQARWAGR